MKHHGEQAFAVSEGKCDGPYETTAWSTDDGRVYMETTDWDGHSEGPDFSPGNARKLAAALLLAADAAEGL